MVVEFPSDQEIRQALLEGEYFEKKEMILQTKKERWPSDWRYLGVVGVPVRMLESVWQDTWSKINRCVR